MFAVKSKLLIVLVFACLISSISLSSLKFSVEAQTPLDTVSTVGFVDEVNWNQFWLLFNAIADWKTEWYSGTEWLNRDSSMQIIRDYPEPNKCKITLRFTSQEAGDYRFSFAIKKVVRYYVEKSANWQYTLTFSGYSVIFDWSDVKDIPGLILTHGVKDNFFWFRMRRNSIPANYYVELDPSVIASADTTSATEISCQRKMFYANGRFWVFYVYASMVYYRSSINGDTWSSAITLGAADAYGDSFCIHYDGTYVHYVRDYDNLFYRRGIPNSDGSIGWGSEQTAVVAAGQTNLVLSFQITTDSSRYPFITYVNQTGVTYTTRVTKSSKNDGSWTTASNFPYTLYAGVSYTSIAGMQDGHIYAVYFNATDATGRLWNGTDLDWQAEEAIASTSATSRHSMAAEGNDIHLVYLNSGNITYIKRTFGVGWGAEETLQESVGESPPVIAVNDSDLYVYWTDSNTFYRRLYVSGSWQDVATWFSYSVHSDSLNTMAEITEGGSGIMWTTGSSPLRVVFQLQPIYNFFGVYEEETGLLKSPSTRAANVTAYFSDDVPETFEVNGTYFYLPASRPTYFRFDLTDLREYWVSPGQTAEDIYIFDDALTTLYTLQFIDYGGILDEYSYVEARFSVNGTMHIVEKRYVDVTKSVLMYLVTGRLYSIRISNGATYTFGDLLMTTDATVTLPLKGMEFPEQIILGYRYVRVWVTRDTTAFTNITINYQDLNEATIQVDITVYFVLNHSQAWTDTQTSSSFVSVWTSADNETDYYCDVVILHGDFGVMRQRTMLPGVFNYGGNPWSLAFLGTLPFNTAYLIPAFILLCVAGGFSALNTPIGLFATTAVAIIFAVMQWLPIHFDILIFVFALVVIYAISKARRRIIT